MEAWIRRKAQPHRLPLYRVIYRWAQLVGPRIAERTRPVGWHRGTLTVAVASSAWLNELSFMRAELLERINAELGKDTVRTLRLVTADLPPPRPRAAAAPPPEPPRPPPGFAQELERQTAGAVDDDRLQRAIVRARLAQYRETGR
jgi:hypothetical protein